MTFIKKSSLLFLGCGLVFGACANKKPEKVELIQYVSFQGDEVHYCASLNNNGDKPLLIIKPFTFDFQKGNQLYLSFHSEEGSPVYLNRQGLTTSLSTPPASNPFPWERRNYFTIEPSNSKKTCRSFPLNILLQTSALSYVRFKPSIWRESKLPFSKAELELNDGPLYDDEAMISNYFRVNFETKTSDCSLKKAPKLNY